MLGFKIGDLVEITEGNFKGKTGTIQKEYIKYVPEWDMDEILFDIKIHKGKVAKAISFGDFKKANKHEQTDKI